MRVTFVAERLNWGRVLGIGVAYVLACFVVLISGERNKDSFFFRFFFFLVERYRNVLCLFLKVILKYFNILIFREKRKFDEF